MAKRLFTDVKSEDNTVICMKTLLNCDSIPSGAFYPSTNESKELQCKNRDDKLLDILNKYLDANIK